MRLGVGLQSPARQRQQGAPYARPTRPGIEHPHPPRAPYPRPAEGAKKYRLGLIVPVMGQNQQRAPGILLQGGMAGLPRRRLEPARVITSHHNFAYHERNAQARAEPGTWLCPFRRTGNQPVADMDRGKFKAEGLAQSGENMQKDSGIKPAAQADPEPGRCDGKLPPLTGDSGDGISRRQFP